MRLILFTHPGGNQSIVTCQRATAEHFGWLTHFKTYGELIHEEALAGNGRITPQQIRAANRPPRGTQIRISRAATKGTYASGRAHSLRINSRVSNIDLAELAHFTEAEWHWMEARNGARVDRQKWLDVYAGRGTIPRATPSARLGPS